MLWYAISAPLLPFPTVSPWQAPRPAFRLRRPAQDRILTRLALTDDDALEPVVSRLLPLLLPKLAQPAPALRTKLLEILSHINKRLHALPALALPLDALLALYRAPGSPPSPVVKNFAVVYLDKAFPRAAPSARRAALPKLIAGIAREPVAQQHVAIRLVLQAAAELNDSRGIFADPDLVR